MISVDFSAVFQTKSKRAWWIDVVLYFAISLLIATVLSYVIFLIKNGMQRSDIEKEDAALQTVGTEQQKQYESQVVSYQRKISDFADLLKNHQFASNIFAFMQNETRPNIWFSSFSLDAKSGSVQLSGEADDMDAFSRQTNIFETNKYVKDVSGLNSSLGSSARVTFSTSLGLDTNIFSYLADLSYMAGVTSSSAQTPFQTEEEATKNQTDENNTVSTSQTQGSDQVAAQSNLNATESSGVAGQEQQQTSSEKSSEKKILSFNLPLIPEVIGVISESNYKILLNVPHDTDINHITPSIIVSKGARILPESGVPENFTNPIIYTVTAEDGTIQNYEVTVAINPAPKEKKPASIWGTLILIVSLTVIAGLVVFAGWFIFKKRKMSQIPKAGMQ